MREKRARRLSAILLLAFSVAIPFAAHATEQIRHRPPAEAHPETSLGIEVHSSHAEGMIDLRLFYRAVGRREYNAIEFSCLETGIYVADIPSSDMRPPGVEYYLAAGRGALRGLRFASPQEPHVVRVVMASEAQKREALLALHDGRRSRASVGFDFVNYGPVSADAPPPGARRFVEKYYSLDVDFTYRFLTTLDSLRFGFSRVRGDSITGGEPLEPPSSVGYDYGFAEIWFALGRRLGLVGELQLGANAEHFTFGVSGGVRIGPDPGTNLLIWGGGTMLVGASGGLKLQWDTVPNVPMSASIDVTTWPDSRVGGLRLVYQAQIPIRTGLHALPEISYQARSARFGRVGGGVRIAYSF